MAGSTPMSAQDALWLTMDRPNNLMVVDGAMVLAGCPDLAAVRAVFRSAVERFPVLGRRAVRHEGTWAWQDDAGFDPDRHITDARLAEPADLAALQRFVAEQRAVPLDRDRPLWRAFLVHPLRLADGADGAAVVTRFHHAIADGVRLTQVMLSLLSDDGSAATSAPSRTSAGSATSGASAWVAPAAGLRGAVLGRLGGLAGAVTGAVSDPVGFVASIPGAAAAVPGRAASVLSSVALEALAVQNGRVANDLSSVAKLAFAGSAATVWSGTPGVAKATAWSPPLPLERIKAVGRAYGATVNDVMLAAVAGGLRRYLAMHGATADEVLWMVPVNLRPFEENLPTELGNYFALVWLPMPLDITDPRARIKELHRRMERIKNSDEAVLTFGLQRLFSLPPRQVTFLVTNFFANKAVGVLTNVPGPRGPMSFAGVPVTQAVGFAPCSGDNPMSATIFSYNGAVTVGFSTDAGLVPDPDVLAACVVEELMAIQAPFESASVRSPRRRRAVGAPHRPRRAGGPTPSG